MDKEVRWSWSGKMIDCNGRNCRLHLGEKEGPGTKFVIEILQRDGHAWKLEGHAEITTEGGNVKIQSGPLAQSEKEKPVKISWGARLQTAEAGEYALKCMFGTYDSSGADASSVLGRGVIVLWQFR